MARPGGLAQAFETIQNNPAMAQMAQQMMQDPTALQRAAQMDLGGALAAGINAAPPNAAQGFQAPPAGGQGGAPVAPSPAASAAPSPPPAAGAGAAAAVPPASAGGGEAGEEGKEMTEDELIAEAIRRSMED